MRNLLVLGGTAWLGREITERLLARGDRVTCLARGESGRPPAEASFVQAERTAADAYAAVAGQQWDEVIELAYEPALVAGALEALAGTAKHWTLVSSVSVYASNSDVPFAQRNNSAFHAAGGDLSDLRQTLQRTLEAEKTEDLNRVRRSGLSRHEELKLLDQLSKEPNLHYQ